jgi:5-methylcytosine-specific restriction endonuclease McrA
MPKKYRDSIKPDMSDCPWPGRSDPEAVKAWKREYMRRFRVLNLEHVRLRQKAYRSSPEGKACIEAYRKAYRSSPEGKACIEAYRSSPEGKARNRAHNSSPKGKATKKRRNARRKQAESAIPLTKEERQQLIILERKRLYLTETTGIMHHLDHIVPLAKGGIHHPINLRIITAEENLSKRDRVTPEAMALIPQIQAIVHERKGWLNKEQDSTLADLFTTDEDET